MRRIYLIDTENVGKSFLTGSEELTNEDKVIIFHYTDSKGTPTGILAELTKTKAKIEYKEFSIHTKNALDFQICTYLGALVWEHGTNAQYYIVSADRGYESAIEFIKMNTGITVKEVKNFSNTTGTMYAGLDEALSSYPKKVRRVAHNALINTKTNQALHNYLQKELPKDGTNVYRLIKSYNEAVA